MIKLFKQNTIGQAIVILLVIAAMWSRAFIAPQPPSAAQCFAPLYDLLYGWLAPLPQLASAVALLLVVTEAVWLNHILTDHKITKAHSLMPILLYVIVMSWNSSQLTITPMLLTNVLLLATTGQLLSDGGTQLTTEHNFNASFCIGLTGLCYLPALYYIVPFIFVFVIYKMYRWRNIIVGILGLIAPFIILFTYAYLSDKLDYYLILMQHDLTNLHFDWQPMPFYQLLPSLVLLTLLVVSLFKQIGSLNDRTIQQRINTGILCLPLLASAILVLYPQPQAFDTQTLAIPFAFTGTRFFMAERKRHWISEVLIWLFLICAIANCLIV